MTSWQWAVVLKPLVTFVFLWAIQPVKWAILKVVPASWRPLLLTRLDEWKPRRYRRERRDRGLLKGP